MSSDFEKLNIILAARDREFARAMDRNTKRIERFARNSNRDLSTVSTKFDLLGTAAKGFAAVLAGGAMATGVARLRTTVTSIAELGDQARRAGLDVQSFQELKFVSEQNRIEVDAMVDGLKELSLRADEFIATGSGAGAEAFNRLGLGADDLARGLEDPAELMLTIIGRLQDLDRAAQIRISDEVFGGSGGERFVELIGQGEAGLRATMDRAHEVGAVLDTEMVARAAEIDRKFAEIETRVASIGKILAIEVVGVMTDLLNGARDVNLAFETMDRLRRGVGIEAGELEGLADASADEMAALAAEAEAGQIALDGAATAASALVGEIRAITLDVGNAGRIDEALALEAAAMDLEALVGAWQRNEIGADEFRARVVEVTGSAESAALAIGQIDGISLSGVLGQIASVGGALAAVARQAIATRAAVADATIAPPSAARQRAHEDRLAPRVATPPPPAYEGPRPSARPHVVDIDSWSAAGEAAAREAAREAGGGGGGKGSKGKTPKLSDWQSELERTRDEIAELTIEAAELTAVADSGREVGDAMDYARKSAELLVAAQASGKEITPELRAEIDQLATSYAAQAQATELAEDRVGALGDRVEDLKATSRSMESAAESMFATIATRASTASDAVAGLLSRFADMAANAAFQGMFGGMFDGVAGIFTGGGGGGAAASGGGGLGGLFGGFREKGGPVRPGQAYVVGEKRPELFVPDQAGRIVPSVPEGGGGGVSITFAPQIDARGADQAAVARLESQMRKMSGEFEGRVVSTVRDARNRRML